MPYGLDKHGRPLFLISTMAMHTQNLLDEPRAALLVTEASGVEDALGAGRVTLMGEVKVVPKEQRAQVRELYLARYANAKYWVDYEDFATTSAPRSRPASRCSTCSRASSTRRRRST
jgi:putative heme iron utilization protein